MANEALAAIYPDREQILKARQRHYETIFVVKPTLEKAESEALFARLTKKLEEHQAQILRNDDWGKLKMAYLIEDHAQGHYFYVRFIGGNQAVSEFERSLKLDSNVLRYQTVRLSDDLSQEAIQDLVEKAPRELSHPPSPKSDEEYYEQHPFR